MKIAKQSTGAPYFCLLSASLFAASWAIALFYHGPQIHLLATAQILLLLWLALIAWQGYRRGLELPVTPLLSSLTLFWLYLAVSLLWSRVPAVSALNFWWVGSFALVFWLYTLSPDRACIWSRVSKFVVMAGLALSVMAFVQLFFLNQPPRATFINIHSFAALLILIALPTCAYFLNVLGKQSSPLEKVFIGASLFMFFFVIASTQGRGTTLSLLIGVLALTAIGWRQVPKRHVGLLWALLCFAYLSANLILHGALADRLVTLSDPAMAGSPRFLIWQGAWEMLKDGPWYGIGLGTYYLAWPPYRHPDDNSLGFFVHNDYLQLGIEIGLPGLISFIVILVAALWMGLGIFRNRVDAGTRLEIAGLFSGLLAVAVHSFVDFDFYILPTSILTGLVLGRFHELSTHVQPFPSVHVAPGKLFGAPGYHIIVFLLLLFPLTYLAALGLAHHFYQRAYAQAAKGELKEADASFAWAEQLSRDDDRLLLGHADLYRHALRALPRSATSDRRVLYDEGLRLLSEAEAANPYRALVFAIRARIYQENADLAGGQWRELAARNYERTLQLNPRLFGARMDYARLLLDNDDDSTARRVSEGGLSYWYYPEPNLVSYYQLAVHLRRQIGEEAQALALEARIQALQATLATSKRARLPEGGAVPIAASTL